MRGECQCAACNLERKRKEIEMEQRLKYLNSAAFKQAFDAVFKKYYADKEVNHE
jgi:hypothetical protein